MKMCNFWSAILTRDGKVLWDANDSSHEIIIKNNNLDDSKLLDRDFVRIEITPKTGKIASKKQSDWELKIDEPKTIPGWYEESIEKYNKLIWAEWSKAMTETLWKLKLENIQTVIDEIKNIPYFKQTVEPLPEWKLFLRPTLDAAGVTAGDAARVAAWSAAWSAAGDAAGVTAGVTARDAAGDAARDAARDAAGDAARDAAGVTARDAAGDAARDAASYCLLSIIPDDSVIERKHREHIMSRMDVWKRGYGLLCDVNGVLYVYGNGKHQQNGKDE